MSTKSSNRFGNSLLAAFVLGVPYLAILWAINLLSVGSLIVGILVIAVVISLFK